MKSLPRPFSTFFNAAMVLSALTLISCGAPPADDPPADLSRFPHVLDIIPRWTPPMADTETRFIDFGTAAGHAFLAEGWDDDGVFENDGATFTWSLGAGSKVRFTAFEKRRLTLTARLRPYRIDGPSQKVEIELNDQPVEVLRLKGGMRTYRFKLPAEALLIGSNELNLRNIYPQDIGPGPPDLGPPGTAWDYLRFDSGQQITAPEVDGDMLTLPFGAEVRFYAELTDRAVFYLERLESSHRGASLDVRLQTEGRDGFSKRRMEPSAQPRHWRLDDARETEGPMLVELSLRAIGGPRAKEGEALRLQRPQLRSVAEIVPAAEIDSTQQTSIASDPIATTESGAERPNVLIYLVDTLRADHLGCYGYAPSVSPRIDAFAADAIVFENAYANSAWTRSTVASLFTGRLPSGHGVYGRDDALAEEASTLAEVLRQEGYATAAFVTNGNAGAQVGLGQGFDTFELLLPSKSLQGHHVLSGTVHRSVVHWLAQSHQRPAFLYLHTIDPHTPYAPPPVATQKLAATRDLAATYASPALAPEVTEELAAFRERVGELSSQAIQPGSLTWLHALQRGLIKVNDDVTRELVSLYDAEILFNDFYFGRLIDHLKKEGLYNNTILIFISDHGEEFRDHQGWEHGKTLYQEQIHVPLIVRFPDGPHGVRLNNPAQQIDLLPTLADVLGLPLPAGVQGQSLWPGSAAPSSNTANNTADESRLVYSQLELDNHSAESLIRGRFKLICTHSRPVGCQLFDLAEDPGEEVDLAPLRPVMARYLRQLMLAFASGESSLKAVRAEEGAGVRKHLRALGYL